MLTSPRSGKTKAIESGADLTVLAMATSLGFMLLRQRYTIAPEIETTATALIMALGGTVARVARHWLVYRRWK